MRWTLFLVACVLVVTRTAGATCLDDCRVEFGGTGEDYLDCVEDCGVCGDGDVEGDEECDDGNTVGGDCCDAACRVEPAGSPCEEDDELCTTDACDGDGECEHEEEPAPDCRVPVVTGKSTLTLRDAEDDAKDLLVWRWRRGQATRKREFGDPPADTAYALCLYDASGLLTTVTMPAADGCGQHPCWSERGGGFRYRSPDRMPEGAAEVLLKQGRRDGRTKLVVTAGGDDLDLPDLGSLESPLTVQLRRSGSRLCWGATYSFPPARRLGMARFHDRSDPAPAQTVPVTSTTTSTAEAPATTSTTTTGPGVTTTTLGRASVAITVVDAAAAPVADADVTITYAGGEEDFDTTDQNGVVVFPDQPVGVAARIEAVDLDDRTGQASSPGFAPGVNHLTVTVR
jgi:cysteine-rich repeat protein